MLFCYVQDVIPVAAFSFYNWGLVGRLTLKYKIKLHAVWSLICLKGTIIIGMGEHSHYRPLAINISGLGSTADPGGGANGGHGPPPKPKMYAPPRKRKEKKRKEKKRKEKKRKEKKRKEKKRKEKKRKEKKRKKKKGEKERQNKTPQLYAPSLCS